MSEAISCICGYRGPAVVEGPFTVCPICRLPVTGGTPRAAAPPAVPGAAAPATAPGSTADDGPAALAIGASASEEAAGSPTYTVRCPKGHTAKVPEEMLGEELVCPRCSAAFTPRLTDSLEYRRQREKRRREEEERKARMWLTTAIVAAVLIGLSFVAMAVIALST